MHYMVTLHGDTLYVQDLKNRRFAVITSQHVIDLVSVKGVVSMNETFKLVLCAYFACDKRAATDANKLIEELLQFKNFTHFTQTVNLWIDSGLDMGLSFTDFVDRMFH